MSKTLPTAITTGKIGDSERVLLVRVIPESGDSWSEYDWATKDITVTAWDGGADKTFLGGVLKENSFTPISQSVDVKEGGNIGTIGGLTFKLANPQFDGENRFDEGVDTYNFENRTVEIWLAFWTGTNPAYTDLLLLYRSVIVDTSYEYGVYEFRVESADVKRHRSIPNLSLNKTDYYYIPDYNLGKIAPLLYGQLCGSGVGIHSTLYVPMILIEKGKGKYLASRNKMAVLGSVALAIYHSETGDFQVLYTDPLVAFPISYGRPTVIDMVGASAAELRGEYFGFGTEEGSKTSNFFAADIKQVMDRNVGSGLLCDATYTKVYIHIPIPSNVGSLGLEAANNSILRINFGAISAGVTGTVRYYNPEYDNGAGGYSTGLAFTNADANDPTFDYDFGLDKSAHGRMDDQSDQNDAWTPEEISSYEWGLDCIITGLETLTIDEIYMRLYNTIIRSSSFVSTAMQEWADRPQRRRMFPVPISIDNLQQDNLCGYLQGEEFGSWIGSRSTAVGYSDGDLIDSGVWHIEAILRSELGMGDDDINMDSFDVIGNSDQRKYWPLANVVTQQKNSLDHIAGFCHNAAIIFFTDYEQKAKVLGLYKTASTVKTINRTTIREDTIKVGLSPLDQVYNEFEIIYGRHWVSNIYRRSMLCDASTHNMDTEARAGTPNTYTGLCADSQTKYNMTRKFSFVADWLSEQTDWGDGAEKLLKWFAEWFCYRRWIVEFDTNGLDHIDLELGDQVKIDHTLLPDAVSNTSHFMLFDIKHDPNKDRLKFKFVQIPDLLP